jgi:hypothetical protein
MSWVSFASLPCTTNIELLRVALGEREGAAAIGDTC